jgi:predicted glycosyltransferase
VTKFSDESQSNSSSQIGRVHRMSDTTVQLNPNLYSNSISIEPPPEADIREAEPAIPPAISARNGKAGKIWIDIDNSPHVPFFRPIVEELQKRGYEIELTGRDIYQVCELLEFFNLPCKVIGKGYGKNTVLKVLGNCLRAAQLIPTAGKFHADLAISHGSRAQVLVSKLLGIPTVMMHDYEHSTKTGFIEADYVFMPDVIPSNSMSSRSETVFKYPGLKEDVYVPQFVPDFSSLSPLGISQDQIIVTLRPPATEAHYHNPEAELLFAEVLRFMSENPLVRGVVLPRNQRQGDQLRRHWPKLISSGSLIIPSSPVDGLNLIWFSDLMVSGGGTMNREAAALGVPVYSVFRGKIGAVDKYLAENGRLILLDNLKDVRTKVVLAHRNRPFLPDDSVRPALQTIVNNIISILEKKNVQQQAKPRGELDRNHSAETLG